MKALSMFRPVLLVAAPFFLALGLVLPLVRFETLYFFDDTPSLIEIIVSLWQGGDGLLAAIVALVSILLPLLKMIGITAEAMGMAAEAPAAGSGVGSLFYRRVVPHLSKWSMMTCCWLRSSLRRRRRLGWPTPSRSPASGATRPRQ